jgi:hypothetical protein
MDADQAKHPMDSSALDLKNINDAVCSPFGKSFCTTAASGFCSWHADTKKCTAKASESESCTIL